jgi:hypothetical protein
MKYRGVFRNFEVLKFYLLFIIYSGIISSCANDIEYTNFQSERVDRDFQTKNVIVVVVDGLRYSEGWGDVTHQYIPKMAGILAKEGVINTHFYNMGATYTSAGHTSFTTGIYQTINNSGKELPSNPSIFQYWNQVYGKDQVKSWVFASKDKLAVLADCKNTYWNGKFTPSVNAGIEGLGLGSGYREDSLTLKIALKILSENHPNLVLINFRDPDYSAHPGNWISYINGIRSTDEYVYRLWQFIQTDSTYKNTTTLFVTNDHGRHLDGVGDGFTGHGDGCDGCRHISLFACGPDFRKNVIVDVSRGQIDLPVTVSEILGFSLPNSSGKVMPELFKQR